MQATQEPRLDRLVTEVGTRLLHEGREKPFTFISGDYHCLSTEMGFLSAKNLKQSLELATLVQQLHLPQTQ